MLFTKKIIQPGTYLIDRPGGKKARVYIGDDRIDRMVKSFGEMKKNGLNVPIPWRHDKQAMPRLDMDEQDVDAFKNAGFVKKFWKGDDGALYGQLEVKNRSDAAKVGKTVIECSPRIDAKWTDGKGEEYEDAITHVALVTHPVIPNQDNFVPVEDSAIALSLGSRVAAVDITALPLNFASSSADHSAVSVGVDSVGGQPLVGNEGFDTSVQGASGDVQTAIQALSLMGIVIPKDTDLMQLPERIVVAAQNYVAGREQADDLPAGQSTSKRPKGSKEQQSPIIMSAELQAVVENQTQIAERIAAGEELTVEYLQSLKPADPEPVAQFSAEQEAMLNHAQKQLKDGYRSRIERCVQQGQISPQIAKEKGAPLLETIELAFNADGQQVANALDVILETWEAIEPGAFLTGKAPTTVKKSSADLFGVQAFSLHGLSEESAPEGMDAPVDGPPTEQEGAELATSILEMSGIPH